MFKPKCSKVKEFKPQCSKVKEFKPQSSKDKSISVISEIRSFLYILIDERVGVRVKNVLFRGLCMCFIINEL